MSNEAFLSWLMLSLRPVPHAFVTVQLDIPYRDDPLRNHNRYLLRKDSGIFENDFKIFLSLSDDFHLSVELVFQPINRVLYSVITSIIPEILRALVQLEHVLSTVLFKSVYFFSKFW